jgi:hypothetical protein
MRKLTTIAVLAASLQGSAVSARDKGWDPILVKFGSKTFEKHVEVEVPEVYELASIIISLTPYGGTRTRDSDYRKRVEAHFGAHRSHPLIAKLNIATEADIGTMFDLRENASAYCFDAKDPTLIVHCQPYSHAWGRVANVFARNLDLIRDFAEKSGFRQFYAQNASYYQELVRNYSAAAPLKEMERWLEARFEDKDSHQKILFSPLTAGWHSTQQFHDEGKALFVMFIEPGLHVPPNEPYQLSRIVFTEIDHNYVNPVSSRFADRLKNPTSFGGNYWLSNDPSYNDGERIFNELMTFGVFELWAREHYGAARADEVSKHVAGFMEKRRFRHYDAFAAELRRLYAKLGPDKMIATLYPDLLAWAERHRASTGGAS